MLQYSYATKRQPIFYSGGTYSGQGKQFRVHLVHAVISAEQFKGLLCGSSSLHASAAMQISPSLQSCFYSHIITTKSHLISV